MLLLTGGSGYLGSRVLAKLAARDVPVTAIFNQRALTDSGLSVAAVEADLTDCEAVARLVAGVAPVTVIHLAARLPGSPNSGSMSDNVEITRNLVDACARAPVQRLVFASTVSVYPMRPADGVAHVEEDALAPGSDYGVSKRCAEDLVRAWAAETGRTSVILRFSGIHGPPRRSGVLHRFVDAAVSGSTLCVTEPDAVFSFLLLDDAAEATLRAAEAPLDPGAHIFNIAGAESLSLAELARRIVAASGGRSAVINGDAPPRTSVMSIEKSRIMLGCNPREIDPELRHMIEKYRAT